MTSFHRLLPTTTAPPPLLLLLLLAILLPLVFHCTPGRSSTSSFVLGFHSIQQQQQLLLIRQQRRRHDHTITAVQQQQQHTQRGHLLHNSIQNDDLDTTDHDGNEEPFSFSHDNETNDSSSSVSRRLAVEQIIIGGTTALLSLLLLDSTAKNPAHAAASAATNKDGVDKNTVSRDDEYNDKQKKRILITGSNSGIGFDAAQRMVLRGHEVVLACRTLDKAIAAADKIRSNIANNAHDAIDANSLLKSLKLLPMECNLADLSSIDAFVNKYLTNHNNHNNNNPHRALAFDAVCYNAGIARNIDAKDVARTKDGFELTVGTNHLGHFYLNHLLLKSNLINNGDDDEREGGGGGGRIVVTSSSVHDPESPGGAQGATAALGDLGGLEYAVSNGSRRFDMVDGGPFDADKAYKDSKLCNILFARELQRRLDRNEYGSSSKNNIKVNCFTPGLIVGTGLFRDQNQVFTKVFDIAATNVLKVGETTHYGGGALEYMTLSSKVGERSGGSYYYSPPGSSKFGDEAFGKQFDVSNVGKEAQESDDNGKARRLWELSEKLVGISSPM